MFQPQVRFGQGIWINPTVVLAAFNLTVHQAGALQHHHMLGNCIEGYGEGLGNFADGGGTPGKRLQDGATSGIRQCGEDPVKALSLRIFNHTVEY